MQTIQEFLTKHPIRLDVRKAEPDEDTRARWPEGSHHYRCILTNDENGYYFGVDYHMGPALTEEPTVETVLGSLAIDAICLDDMPTFEAFAHDTGADIDSRREERLYDLACRYQANLRLMLGDSVYEELVYETEHDWD